MSCVNIFIDEDDYLVNAQDIIAQRFCFVKVIVVKGGTFTDAINEIAEAASTTSYVQLCNVPYISNITHSPITTHTTHTG
jgi:hypothetical protein